eukprot:8348318-Ditylum_brightwellii.AAC.1
MPNRQEPVTNDMINYIINQAEGKHKDSLEAAMREWITLGEYTGFRLSKWAQEERFANKRIYATNRLSKGGDGLPKAFIMDDFKMFAGNNYNINNDVTTILSEDDVKSMNIRWRYQKNNKNGQQI